MGQVLGGQAELGEYGVDVLFHRGLGQVQLRGDAGVAAALRQSCCFAVALLAVSFGTKVKHGVGWAAIPLGLIAAQ